MTVHQDADGVWRLDAETHQQVQAALAPVREAQDTFHSAAVKRLHEFLNEVENEMPKGTANRLYDAGWRIVGAEDHLAEIERTLNIVAYNADAESEYLLNQIAAIALVAADIYI